MINTPQSNLSNDADYSAPNNPTPAGEWAIVEIMGHRTHAGLITEVQRFGTSLIQIVTPELPEVPEVATPGTRELWDNDGHGYVTTPGKWVKRAIPMVPSATIYYGGAAIFSITPCTEATAIEHASSGRTQYCKEWIPDTAAPLALSAPDTEYQNLLEEGAFDE